MLLSHVFERFVERTPFAVMARSLLERTLTPEALDALFEEKADTQYTRELTFSSVVDLMARSSPPPFLRCVPPSWTDPSASPSRLPPCTTSSRASNPKYPANSSLIPPGNYGLSSTTSAAPLAEPIPGYEMNVVDGKRHRRHPAPPRRDTRQQRPLPCRVSRFASSNLPTNW